jgi:Calcineurin-like phosphoesterase
MSNNIIGPKGQLYAEQKPGLGETQFREDNNSAAYYTSVYYKAHKNQVQPIPAPRGSSPLNLSGFLTPDIMAAINKAKKISFHAVGDTGAAKVSRSQTVATAIGHESAVADTMAADVQNGGAGGPAFFFHLGDVIYNFGEGQYYYDQFYEPFRAYDRPIFAIPGNHDGMVFGPDASRPQVPTLKAFQGNFCAATPGLSADAGGLVRSVMTQPGVYFTLDAPYVSIIGLYSNVLDGPGIISSQGKKFPLADNQLDFLKSELTRLKPNRNAFERAVVLAVHHPPLSADAKHGGSTGVQADLDACCKATGLWPDLVISGHAHLYQRFTRTTPDGKKTPYIVSGSGGFAATDPMEKIPKVPFTTGDHTLEIKPIVEFGYLTIEADGNQISVVFKTATTNGVAVADSVSVDLRTGKLSSGAAVRSKKSPTNTSAKKTKLEKTKPKR